MRKFLVAAFLAVLCQQALADDPPVRFSDVYVESGIGETRLREQAYVIGYTIENTGSEPIVALRIVVIGRNESGQIVETQDSQAIARSNLPGGLAPGEQMVRRHGLLMRNPNENVHEIEVRVMEFRLSN